MPVMVMPEAVTPEAAVPGQAMPGAVMPGRTMPVGEETPAGGKTQKLEVVHLERRPLVRLDRTGMPGQPTDISVGMTTTTTVPT